MTLNTEKGVYYLLALVILLLLGGTFYFNQAEGWSYVDSFYFSTMTLTTIGYGDLVPTTDNSKLFTSFYAIFGVGAMLYFLGSVVVGLVVRQEKLFTRAVSFFTRLKKSEQEIHTLKKLVKKQK